MRGQLRGLPRFGDAMRRSSLAWLAVLGMTVVGCAKDRDKDGYKGDDDCDDLNPSSTIVAEDMDCDGVLSVDDCDDNDVNNLSNQHDDNDGDAVCNNGFGRTDFKGAQGAMPASRLAPAQQQERFGRSPPQLLRQQLHRHSRQRVL